MAIPDFANDTVYNFLTSSIVGQRATEPLPAGLNWETVWSAAEQERVTPLLYQAGRHGDLLPDWLLERCHKSYLDTGMQNALRFREAAQVLGALGQAGIEVVALKGLALAEPVYGNIALRPMSDVDLLVRRADVPAALAVLADCGYERGRPDLASQVALEFENEALLWKVNGLEWPLELHWSLFDSPFYQQKLPEDLLWSSLEEVQIEGTRVNILTPELQILHLCGHLALHHQWQGLIWWHDVAILIEREVERLDWPRLISLAREIDLVIPLQTVLVEVTTTWSSPVPPEVLESVTRLAPTEDETTQLNRLTRPHRTAAQRLLDDMTALSSWSERLRFLGHNLFPSTAYMDARYGITHPGLRPLYYVKRWFRGVAGLVASTATSQRVDE